jgi:hypothetical protein
LRGCSDTNRPATVLASTSIDLARSTMDT